MDELDEPPQHSLTDRIAALTAEAAGEEDACLAKGLTLYKYHAVPVIAFGERQLYPQQPEQTTLQYAHIRASLRWCAFSSEQEHFWRQRTAAFIDGKLSPLSFETYNAFVEGDFSRQVAEPQSRGNDSEGDLEHFDEDRGNSDGEMRGLELCAGPVEAHNATAHTERDFPHPGLARNSSECSSHRAPSSLPPHGHASIFPDNNTTDSVTSQDTSFKLVLGRSDIETMVEKLRQGQGSLRQHRALMARVQPDGSTLFTFHARALARHGLPQALSVHRSGGWRAVWKQLPQAAQDLWKDATQPLLCGLGESHGEHNTVLNHFETSLATNRSLRYRLWAQDGLGFSLTPHSTIPPGYVAGSISTNGCTSSEWGSFSLVHLLLGEVTHMDNETLTNALTSKIRSLLRTDVSARTKQVCWDGVKIEALVEATGPQSIHNRLDACVKRGLTPQDAHLVVTPAEREYRLNRVLTAYFCINRAHPGLQLFKDLCFESWNYEIGSKNLLRWAEEVLPALRPLTAARKEKAVAMLMTELRRRAHIVDRNHGIFKPSAKWSIANNYTGFASRLLDCFRNPSLLSAEYEDLIEQTMWAFCNAVPSMAQIATKAI